MGNSSDKLLDFLILLSCQISWKAGRERGVENLLRIQRLNLSQMQLYISVIKFSINPSCFPQVEKECVTYRYKGLRHVKEYGVELLRAYYIHANILTFKVWSGMSLAFFSICHNSVLCKYTLRQWTKYLYNTQSTSVTKMMMIKLEFCKKGKNLSNSACLDHFLISCATWTGFLSKSHDTASPEDKLWS